MKYHLLTSLIFAQVLFAGPVQPGKPTMPEEARQVLIRPGKFEPIYCVVKMSCLLQLPASELVMAIESGAGNGKDTQWWIKKAGNGRYVQIKPVDPDIQNTLHVITDHNNAYTFQIYEASHLAVPIDVRVDLVNENGDEADKRAKQDAVFVPAAEVSRWKAEAESEKTKAEAAAQQAKNEAHRQIVAARNVEITAQDHDYAFDRDKPPFFVLDIYTADNMTYIRIDPHVDEVPILNVVKDGKDELPDYQYQNGLFKVSGRVLKGVLIAGKKSLKFEHKGV